MNKKIKIIDIFNIIANGEEIPERILFKGIEFIWKNNHYMSKDNKTNLTIDIMNDINLEIEILEDNTEDIEELEIDEKGFIHTDTGAWKGRKLDLAFADKINELVKAIKSIRKDLNK